MDARAVDGRNVRESFGFRLRRSLASGRTGDHSTRALFAPRLFLRMVRLKIDSSVRTTTKTTTLIIDFERLNGRARRRRSKRMRKFRLSDTRKSDSCINDDGRSRSALLCTDISTRTTVPNSEDGRDFVCGKTRLASDATRTRAQRHLTGRRYRR